MYIWPLFTGGVRTWPRQLDHLMSPDVLYALNKMEEIILPVIPQPCDKKQISATPGNFVPALTRILEEYCGARSS